MADGTHSDAGLAPGAARSTPLPSALVVMGVSGCGKSTIASMLAQELGWTFRDGDSFHPPANVEKMHSGVPLTDDDRWPWLRSIAAWIDERRRSKEPAIVACSALRRAYRDILVGARRDVRLVYLKGDISLIADRLAARQGHFMPAGLLRSQFETLEEPRADERPIVVSIELPPDALVAEIIRQIGNP